MRTFLGVAIGTAVTPALVHNLPREGMTLLLVPFFVLVIGLICYPFLRRVFGYDHPTAFYSAMPGGLQDMLIFGEAGRRQCPHHVADPRHPGPDHRHHRAPPAGLDLRPRPDPPARVRAATLPVWEIALMIVGGPRRLAAASRVGLFGASILGPLIVTGGAVAGRHHHHRPPAEMIWIGAILHRHRGRSPATPGSPCANCAAMSAPGSRWPR